MSLHEALANGCPAISYKYKYGPQDVMRDGENGFLIDKNNIEQLVEKTLDYFALGDKRKDDLIINAYNSVRNLDYSVYKQNWKKLLETVRTQFDENIYDLKINAELIETSTDYLARHKHYKIKLTYFTEHYLEDSHIKLAARLYNKDKTSFQTHNIENSINRKKDRVIEFVIDVTFEENDISICFTYHNCFYEVFVKELENQQ